MYACLISKRYYDKQRRHEEEINLDISPKEIIIKRRVLGFSRDRTERKYWV